MSSVIKINFADNVAVAVSNVAAGDICYADGRRITAAADIPAGHKMALKALGKGDNVIKYGYPIGHLLEDVPEGGLIDHRILKTNLEGILEYKYEPIRASVEKTAAKATFKGYRRADGRAGVRNELWVVPTVGCVNGVAQSIAGEFSRKLSDWPSIEKVVAFPHNYGCSQLGDDHENTRRILADIVRHPNAAGVLVVALGCENNQLSAFREFLGPVDENRIKFLECQKVEGNEIPAGLGLLEEIAEACSGDRREEIPASELKVGLKCGGSDGFSGTMLSTASLISSVVNMPSCE